MKMCVHRFFEDDEGYFCSICGQKFTMQEMLDEVAHQQQLMAERLGAELW